MTTVSEATCSVGRDSFSPWGAGAQKNGEQTVPRGGISTHFFGGKKHANCLC